MRTTRRTIYLLAAALFACDADTEGLDGPEAENPEPSIELSGLTDTEIDQVITQLCSDSCASPHRCFEDIAQENCFSDCVSTATQIRSTRSQGCFQVHVDFLDCLNTIDCESLIDFECSDRFSSDRRCDFN